MENCEKCGHRWSNRRPKPIQCPKCHNRAYKKPYKYSAKRRRRGDEEPEPIKKQVEIEQPKKKETRQREILEKIEAAPEKTIEEIAEEDLIREPTDEEIKKSLEELEDKGEFNIY